MYIYFCFNEYVHKYIHTHTRVYVSIYIYIWIPSYAESRLGHQVRQRSDDLAKAEANSAYDSGPGLRIQDFRVLEGLPTHLQEGIEDFGPLSSGFQGWGV